MKTILNLYIGSKINRQRGDTIIEVLIAIAIVSLVLTSAYALTNRNVRAIQEVQEQTQAQKLVEQQVELLRAADPKPSLLAGCFKASDGMFVTPVSAAVCTQTNGGASYKLEVRLVGTTYTIKATWNTLGSSQASVTYYYQAGS